MPGDPNKFYAAFTTGASDGLVGSAICTYTMDDIQEAFSGRFKEQVSFHDMILQNLELFSARTEENKEWIFFADF